MKIFLSRPLFYIIISCVLLSISSCNDEEEEPEPESDFVIVDDNNITIDLTWTVPGNENGFEVANLDLATSDLLDNTININSREFVDRFERLTVNTLTPDNTFRVRVRYFAPLDSTRSTATYTLTISNSDSTVSRVFTNTIAPPAEGDVTTWIDEEVQVPATIWKSGNQYTFLE